MKCAIDLEGRRACAAGAYCAGDSFCRASPEAGEACADAQDGGQACADSSFCRTSLATPMCVALPGAGEPCAAVSPAQWGWVELTGTAGRACAEGLACFCDDYSYDCAARPSCRRIRLLGESCAAAGDLCEPGTRCDAGVCALEEPIDSFDRLCGP